MFFSLGILVSALVLYLLIKVIRLAFVFKKLKAPVDYTNYAPPDIEQKISSQNIPESVDYIIVGSGVGSLVSGALLAKLNNSVLVLESHTVAGGCCHTFVEKGYEFDTGFHYIGDKKDFRQVLEMVQSKPIVFNNVKVYDRIKFGQEPEFPFCAPKSEFIKNLKSTFPKEHQVIDAYFKYFSKTKKLISTVGTLNMICPTFLVAIMQKFVEFYFADVYGKSCIEIAAKIGLDKNPKLMYLLGSQFGDLGYSPKTGPFAFQVLLQDHYMNGSIYPRDGVRALIESICYTITSKKGTILTKAKVDEIMIEQGRAVGVRVGKHTILCKKGVISGAGSTITKRLIEPQVKWQMNEKEGISHYYLFLGLKNVEVLDKYESNLWHFQQVDENYSIDEIRQDYLNTGDLDKMFTFTSFSTPKKIKHNKVAGEKHDITGIMIAEAFPDWVQEFRVNQVQRMAGYKQHKLKVQEKMLSIFKQNYPELFNKIDYVDTATPLTNENYLGRFSSYGLEMQQSRVLKIGGMKRQTIPEVESLWLTGEDSFSPGVSASIASGLFTVMSIQKLL